LVGNTTAELVPGDDDARDLAAAAYDGFTQVVTAALVRAQATGEVTTSATPRRRRGCCCSSSKARRWCRARNPTVTASPPA